jgi:lipid-binding SYLF domain-containing protein/peptidoglycan hydrolase-like protein with peptidoglycan-binding domain
MSVNKLGIAVFCGFLTFATAPFASAQSTQKNMPSKDSSDGKQTRSTREALGLDADHHVSDREAVRQVQQALAELMYNPGEANGMLSSQTQQAIREFQWLNDLPVSGSIDEQTKAAIDTQYRGGTESARSGKTYSSSTTAREKPAMSTEERQSSERSQDKNYDKIHGPAVQQDRPTSNNSDAIVKQEKDRDSTNQNVSGKSDKDAVERVSKAAAVLQDLTGAADKRIPNELLERAEAIAVIPNVIKGAFGIGGRYGKGVVAQRAENGRWSAPAFVEIGGGSFGAQIGVTSTDLVLVFTDRNALNVLDGGKDLKLGVDAGVAAGPVGRSAEAGVNAKLDTAIYSYSRSKGLFAGVALDGAVLSIDKDTNAKVYGSSLAAKEILSGTVGINSTVQPFMDALDKSTPRKRMSQR